MITVVSLWAVAIVLLHHWVKRRARLNDALEPDDQARLTRMDRPHILRAGRGVWRES